MSQQTVIPYNHGNIDLDDCIGEENQLLVNEIRHLIQATRSSNILFFWGPSNSGKSYLLEAAINEAIVNGQHAEIIKLKQGTEQLQHLEARQNSFYAIDDVDLIVSSKPAEEKLLTLYEQLKSGTGRILLSSNTALAQIAFNTEDLRSRISSGGLFQLIPIGEESIYQALQHRASKKGIKLDDSVITYIRNHYHRDARAVFALLDKIDSASLQTQRKITIPFIKQLLSQ